MVAAEVADEVIVQGKRLISHERAAALLGMLPASVSSAISRGTLKLTRYYAGHRPRFDLAEVEKALLARAVPPDRRKRRR